MVHPARPHARPPARRAVPAILENSQYKTVLSPDYNYQFNKKTGYFSRWGATPHHDPDYSPFGPEIADIEITTVCDGPAGRPCAHCYKSNGPRGKSMSLETFKAILAKMPATLTQVALGADANLTANPDTWAIFEHCRERGIVPNITVADIDDETADRLAALAGAVAVSRYENKDLCYNSVARLTARGMAQVNIHVVLSQETLPWVLETIDDLHTDSRLSGVYALIFLSLKQVGRGQRYAPLTQEQFDGLVATAYAKKIHFGMDTCSVNKFAKSVAAGLAPNVRPEVIEPCESLCFSIYVNVDGRVFSCSFAEHCGGIDLLTVDDFLRDVWHSDYAQDFRARLANKDAHGHRQCPLFSI